MATKKTSKKMSLAKKLGIVFAVILLVAVIYCGVCGGFALVKGTTWTSEFLSFCGAIKSTAVATATETQAFIGL